MSLVVKPKRRNSEKRKEKSRDAARSRRSKESEIFLHLAQKLPVSFSVLAQLDKASIVRLAISHLKIRELFQNDMVEKSLILTSTSPLQQRVDHLFCRSLDGFLMLVDREGNLVYITENVVHHLGLLQIDLLGHSVYDFIHPCDHEEMQDVVCHRNRDECQHSVFLRIKSTLSSRARSVNIKSAYYKVIHCWGSRMSTGRQELEPLNLSKSEIGAMSFTLLMCRPLAHPSNTDILLDSRTFVSHHNMDMTFIFCDERVSDLLGFKSAELVGKSLYNYHHAFDTEVLDKSYRTLFAKGQCSTGLYRFLAKTGGYVWMETQSSVINNPRTDKAQFIVCINVVVSGLECGGQIFSTVQQQGIQADVEDVEEMVKEEEVNVEDDSEKEEMEDDEDEAVFSTESILNAAAGKINNQGIHHVPDGRHASEKALPLFKPRVTEIEMNAYEQIAPYISMDDTVFGLTAPGATDKNEKSLTQSGVGLVVRPQDGLLTNVLDTIGTNNHRPAPGNTAENAMWSTDRPIVSNIAPVFKSKVASFPSVDPPQMFQSSIADKHLASFAAQKFIQSVNGSSVLKNLLVNGEDVNYGYRLLADSCSGFGAMPQRKMPSDESTSTDKSSFSLLLHQLLCSAGQCDESS